MEMTPRLSMGYTGCHPSPLWYTCSPCGRDAPRKHKQIGHISARFGGCEMMRTG